MGAQLTVLALLMCLCALLNQIGIVGASVPRSLAKRKVDPEWAYSAKDFYRRAWHTSMVHHTLTRAKLISITGIVVGNHLYIDGGEIYYLNNASSPKSLPLNSTYSIDLSVSWTNDSVVLNPIEKTSAPSLNVGNLFPDPSGTSFYQWNGKISSSIPYDQLPTPPRANLWQFRIDGDSGQWSLVNAPNLERLSRSASTQGNGTAYFLGGFGDWRTSTDYYSNANLRHSGGGLVSYEIQSQNWNNESIEEMAPTGWSFDAEFYYLEGLRREGLLLAMGGATSPPGTSRTGDESLNPYSYVTLYDTAAKKWYNQSTSGDIPSRRYDPCTVGVPGDNGTFEVSVIAFDPSARLTDMVQIFMYGGSVIGTATYEEEQQSNIDLADVSILSVPSFRWYKTNLNPTSSRYRHSCEVVGQRQMVAIGGLTSGVTYANITKDPWAQGLGIFDLTDLEWRSSYDASAKAYQTPNLVKEDLAQNGQYPSTWDSNIVEGWFTNRGKWFTSRDRPVTYISYSCGQRT